MKILTPILASAAFFCAGHLKATTYSYDFNGYITEAWHITNENVADGGKPNKARDFEHGQPFSGNLTWSDVGILAKEYQNYYYVPGTFSFSIKNINVSSNPSKPLDFFNGAASSDAGFGWWPGFDGVPYNGLISMGMFFNGRRDISEIGALDKFFVPNEDEIVVDLYAPNSKREVYRGKIAEGRFSTVPDSGTTLVMLSFALGGLWLLKRHAFGSPMKA